MSVATVPGGSAPAGAKSVAFAIPVTTAAVPAWPAVVKSVPPSFGVAVATGETGVSRASKRVSDGAVPAVATTEVRLQTSR